MCNTETDSDSDTGTNQCSGCGYYHDAQVTHCDYCDGAVI